MNSPAVLADLVLALDCSFGGLSLGVFNHGELLASFEQPETRSTTQLALVLERLWVELSVGVQDFSRVVVTVGPGSFTGIRLGLAVAEALKVANPALEITGVSTLSAVAASAPSFPCAVLLDAAGGMVYYQLFQETNMPEAPPVCVPLAEAILPPGYAVVAGPGVLLDVPFVAVSTVAPLAVTALAETPGGAMPALPFYVKPLAYKPHVSA